MEQNQPLGGQPSALTCWGKAERERREKRETEDTRILKYAIVAFFSEK